MFVGALLVLAVAICLAVDLGLKCSARQPPSCRTVWVAVFLVALITCRICERMADGSL